MQDIIVITGATAGIGKALALELANKNHRVLAVARRENKLQELKSLHPDYIEILVADVAKEEDRDRIASFLQKGTFKVKALVNNAALAAPSGNLTEIDLNKWRYQIAVNLEAPLFLTSKLKPLLAGGGRVLNISIYSSFRVTDGLGAYGLSKAAVNMATKYLNSELQQDGISVGLVLPGVVATDMQKQLPDNLAPKMAKIRHKFLTPEVTAKFLAWLLLDVSSENFAKEIWDIYDEKHHQYWAKDIIVSKSIF